jgi:hypothetical protein
MLLKVYRRQQAKSDKNYFRHFNAKPQSREATEKWIETLRLCVFAPSRWVFRREI